MLSVYFTSCRSVREWLSALCFMAGNVSDSRSAVCVFCVFCQLLCLPVRSGEHELKKVMAKRFQMEK